MGQYDTQEVCLNGHQTTDSYYSSPEFRKKFCDRCGAPTIHACPNCGKDIKGDYFVEGVFDFSSTPVPDVCENCGKDFPWTEKKRKIEKSSKDDKSDPTFLLQIICERFHLVAKQLRQRHADRPTLDIADEYDVQDLLHALLTIYFDDIRPEEWNQSHAGKSTRVDFLLKEERIVIEVKKTRATINAKQLGDELIIDIAHYRNNPDCEILYCFVYDPEGYIRNPIGFENDLSKKEEEFRVLVLVVPKGH